MYQLHTSFSWVVIISNAAAGLWALAAHRYTVARHHSLWWFTGAAQMTVLVQVVFGVILVNNYGYPLPQFHAFYGFLGIVAAGIIYSYRVQMRHRLYLLYGVGELFIMGLSIRALWIGDHLS